ncbi:MAG: hypothetical protein SFW08_04045 [Gemmatimonadaceae bacterium]|nr:hypothetical protein [Gemmatimonadaceae bacterium]
MRASRGWRSVRLAALVLVAPVLGSACAGGRAPAASQGRDSPRQAVSAFLDAAKQRDVEAMAKVWGSQNGSALNTMAEGERDKRILIIQCHLQHDRSTVVAEFPGDDGRRVFRVELTFQGVTLSTTVAAVKGPAERWFVESADIEKTAEFCRRGGVGR